MSLQRSISVVEEVSSFIVNECTGNFSFENKGGWGGPNSRIKDITDAYLEITPVFDANPFLDVSANDVQPPSTDVLKPSTFTIKTFPDFPNEEGNGFEVLPYQVGQPDNFLESGKWKIKSTVTGVDSKGKKFTKTATKDVVFVKNVTCCVDKLMKNVNGKLLNDTKQKTIVELSNLLESMCYSNECGLLDQANEIIGVLKAQCKCCGC